ncbi:MAG: DUF3592 domain-containing protein [Acidobacteria bacterium]|nr:DUF3592 domain-containing protein [Acidobacteriota bacterium]
MTEKAKSEKMSCTLGGLLFLALTGVQVWYMDGFLPRAGQIIFSIIGGLLLQTVVFQLIRLRKRKKITPAAFIAPLFVFGFGALTWAPVAPDTWLLKTFFGWNVLEDRSDRLEHAIRESDSWLVQKLARSGVGDLAPRDSFGSPLLHDCKDPEILNILLEAGFDPDVRDERGDTLLMGLHDAALAPVLITHGADMNARNNEGLTPLMHAVRTDDVAFARALVDAGADLYARDDHGRGVAYYVNYHEDMIEYMTAQMGGELRREEVPQLVDTARSDWLERKDVSDVRHLEPSSITVEPDPVVYGRVADLQIRLTNASDDDRVLLVEVELNDVLLFVEADIDGHIANPYQAQNQQEIQWPLLALPARSSGLLHLRVIARSEEDSGDLVVDVRAQNVLNYQEEPEFINLHQTPSSAYTYEDGSWGMWALVLLFPFSLIAWFVLWRTKGYDHPYTHWSGRLATGLFAWVFGVMAWQMASDVMEPYTHYRETKGTILDRRFYMKTSRSSSSRSRSSYTVYRVPVVAVRYEAGREIIATGFTRQNGSYYELRELKQGQELTLWYDPDEPDQFTLKRGISAFFLIGFFFVASISLGLGLYAIRKTKPKDGT